MFRQSLAISALISVLVLAGNARATADETTPEETSSRIYYSDEPGAESARVNKFGAGARLRWVTVPSWFLGMFTQKNVPLSSYGFALELFQRRRGNLDIVLGVGYQNMSPDDGNWLGKNKSAAIDTDFVQFKGLGMVGIDVSFIWRTALAKYVGLHYGAGLGLGIVTGSMYRTSSAGCTTQNIGDLSACHPAGIDLTQPGYDQALKTTEGRGNDSASNPSRFKDSNVPAVIPIVNLLLGMHFRIPDVKGLELRVEGGFYNAFFLGGAASYAY